MIANYDSEVLGYIDSVLERYLPPKDFPENIYDSVRYSLFGEGRG